MKKLFFIFAIGVGVLGFAQKKNSQDQHKKEILEKDRFSKDFDRMINFEKGKFEKEFKNISSEERRVFFRKVQVQRMMIELNLPIEKQEKAEKLFEKYLEKRDDIMKKFKPDIEKDSLTEQEAIEHIRKGLDVAQKLLDMRKEYTDKFLKVLTPNQVLKMNRVEKDMMLHLKKYKNKNVVKYRLIYSVSFFIIFADTIVF